MNNEIQKGADEKSISQFDKFYKKCEKTIHSLENVGSEQLELIEVQLGDYLEEDDIVRFEDKYGRC